MRGKPGKVIYSVLPANWQAIGLTGEGRLYEIEKQ